MTLRPHAYVLAVHDLAGTTTYCIDALGFARDWTDDGRWEGLVRDGVRLHLGRCPDALPADQLGDHGYFGFWTTDDVDGMHAELVARGALIRSPPTDQPWGWREMAVALPEGHRLMIAQ